jgi:hypothetical protein
VADAAAAYQAMYSNTLGYLAPPGCGPGGCGPTVPLVLEPSKVRSFCFRQNGGGDACGWVYDEVVSFSEVFAADSYSDGAINSVLQAALDEVISAERRV